jgi:hypothetical protein
LRKKEPRTALLDELDEVKVTKKSRQKIQPAGFVVAHTRPARAQIQPVRTFAFGELALYDI